MEIVAAVVGGLIGVVGTLLVVGLQARRDVARAKRDGAAAYLNTLAVALAGMADSFDQGRIPHEQGHLFESLVDSYEPVVGPYSVPGVSVDLRNLQTIASRADEFDGNILAGSPSVDATLPADIRRLAGDLKADAVKLSAQAR
jgi:hypothetical protein